jgi:hypothetical protein
LTMIGTGGGGGEHRGRHGVTGANFGGGGGPGKGPGASARRGEPGARFDGRGASDEDARHVWWPWTRGTDAPNARIDVGRLGGCCRRRWQKGSLRSMLVDKEKKVPEKSGELPVSRMCIFSVTPSRARPRTRRARDPHAHHARSRVYEHHLRSVL